MIGHTFILKILKTYFWQIIKQLWQGFPGIDYSAEPFWLEIQILICWPLRLNCWHPHLVSCDNSSSGSTKYLKLSNSHPINRGCRGHDSLVVKTYNHLCNQWLSPLKLWVQTVFMARRTRYNIIWYSLSVTCNRSVVLSRYSGFLHQ